MSEHKYLHSDTKDEIELNRLRLLERIYDPITSAILKCYGYPRAHCLEVGAGAGSIAQQLSKHVGSTGRMVATDIDLRFLRGQIKNINTLFIVADIEDSKVIYVCEGKNSSTLTKFKEDLMKHCRFPP